MIRRVVVLGVVAMLVVLDFTIVESAQGRLALLLPILGLVLASVGIPGFLRRRGPSDSDVAGHVIHDLENRRVLFTPIDRENPQHCIESVIEMRKMLSQQLSRVSNDMGELGKELRKMRAACIAFQEGAEEFLRHGGNAWIGRPIQLIEVSESGELIDSQPIDSPDWNFDEGLHEFREAVTSSIAQIAGRFGLYVEKRLRTPLPSDGGGQAR
jgi:hypothetical protein